MGNIKQFKNDKGYESISRSMLQDEENLSLGAIGLLANLLSYPDNWELHKTELYKRFKKSSRRQVEKAWDELIEQGYVIQLIRRNGKKWDYIYYFKQMRFTEEEKKQIAEQENAEIWDGTWNGIVKKTKKTKKSDDEYSVAQQNDNNGDDWAAQNEQPNLNSSKCADKRLTNIEIDYQNKDNKDTLLDTDKEEIQNNSNGENFNFDLNEKKKQQEQDRLLKQSLKNHVNIPDDLFYTLNVFSKNYKEMYKQFGILLRAKKQIETKYNELLDLHNFSETINTYFLNAMRNIKTNSEIENSDNYLFVTMVRCFEKIVLGLKKAAKNVQKKNMPLYKWIEGLEG